MIKITIILKDLLGLEGASEFIKEPILKLIEVCSNAIGKLYEPTHKKRMAKASSYEIDIISESIRKNKDLPISYSDEIVKIDTAYDESLIKRAESRVNHQEIEKQQNIEKIISHAYNDLKEEDYVSKEELDKDWITRFFDIASQVSNEELQLIWGRILSGEIKQPGNYSLRTLDVLRNVSRKEAEIFNKLSNCSLNIRGHYFIYDNAEAFINEGIRLSNLSELDDAGLIKTGSYQKSRVKYDEKQNEIYALHGEYIILFKYKNLDAANLYIEFPSLSLTKAGKEICSVIKKDYKENYIRSLANELREEQITVQISKITNINSEYISYDSDKIITL